MRQKRIISANVAEPASEKARGSTVSYTHLTLPTILLV